jgi:hypothetical protein
MLADPLTPLFPTEPSVRYALTLGLAVCATDPVHSERALHRFLVGEHKNPGEIRRPQGPKMKESLPYPQYIHQTAEFLRFQGNQPGQEFNVSVDHRGTGFLTGERKCYPSQAVGRLIFSGNSCE